MESAVTSSQTSITSIASGNIINLPYHLLQKYSIRFFGLTTYAIKLPSIIIAILLGIILILLLNRWFKSNVALLASILATLSSGFLYLAGSGTPLIMLVFWPAFLLWLGSKIEGRHRPKPFYCFIFALSLLLALFTPYLSYLILFILLYVLYHPHLRFTIKKLPLPVLIFSGLIVLAGITFLILNIIKHGSTLTTLFLMPNFSSSTFFSNLSSAFLPFFSWNGTLESHFLAPLIGLATLALAITGLISTTKGFFASRNSIATLLIFYTILISGLNPDAAILLILPLSILIAHGLRYILTKWYGLFPENPYARVFAILPITVFLGLIIISDLSHFIFGYRYNPPVANQFHTDLKLIRKHLQSSDTLLVPAGTLEYDFYKLLEQEKLITIISDLPAGYTTPISSDQPANQTNTKPATQPTPNQPVNPQPTARPPKTFASLGRWPTLDHKSLTKIITSSKSISSDRIYIYTVK